MSARLAVLLVGLLTVAGQVEQKAKIPEGFCEGRADQRYAHPTQCWK